MYALLDIERAGAGLHFLKEVQIWNETVQKSIYWDLYVREFDLSSGSAAFTRDVAWVNTKPEVDWEEHTLIFSIGHPSVPFRLEASLLTLRVNLEDQLPIAVEMRDRYAFASMSFFGHKWGSHLPVDHPAHSVMMAFLSATRPVYAWVMGDVLSPSIPLDAECLSEPWLHNFVDESMFFGPELLAHIPPALLSKEAGFAHIERLGEGVWVTLPGSSTLVTEYPDPSIVERHRAADQAVKKVLAQMPPPPWRQ